MTKDWGETEVLIDLHTLGAVLEVVGQAQEQELPKAERAASEISRAAEIFYVGQSAA